MTTETHGVGRGELGLEHELASLLDVKTFDPPAGFREHALLNDPAVYEEAEADWQGWWVSRPSSSTGSQVGHGPRRFEPAVLQVVRGRPAQRLPQLP